MAPFKAMPPKSKYTATGHLPYYLLPPVVQRVSCNGNAINQDWAASNICLSTGGAGGSSDGTTMAPKGHSIAVAASFA